MEYNWKSQSHSSPVRKSPVDQLERVFFNCLREIEKSYVVLPKALRIRVEKWVEKFTDTGDNPTWRKQRNAYAKLLLNMIISRNFSEPFHTLPAEGPLPAFPFHLKVFTKDLLGPHESSFWRDLYSKVQEDYLGNNGKELVESVEVLNQSNWNHNKSNKSFTQLDQSALNSKENQDVQNLKLLLKEQTIRINLLEQQLKDERIKYELQIRRLNYVHKIEIETIRNNYREVFKTDSQLSTNPIDPMESHEQHVQENHIPIQSFSTQTENPVSLGRNHLQNNLKDHMDDSSIMNHAITYQSKVPTTQILNNSNHHGPFHPSSSSNTKLNQSNYHFNSSKVIDPPPSFSRTRKSDKLNRLDIMEGFTDQIVNASLQDFRKSKEDNFLAYINDFQNNLKSMNDALHLNSSTTNWM